MAAATYSPELLRISFSVLATLIVVLVTSLIVFHWQVKRWTTNRGWRSLLDWSRANGFQLSNLDREPPPPFETLTSSRVTERLQRGKIQLVRLETIGGSEVQTPRWHLLIREMETTWPATALRPAQAATSVIDLFSLSSYPRMGEVERFLIFGTDSVAAQRLSQGEPRALLPPDVGLLLHGRHLVLDFSARPFDGIEFGRMTALAEQIVSRLPLQR